MKPTLDLDINNALARMFGLEGHQVTGFTLTAKAGRLPVMTVTRLLVDTRAIKETKQKFTLVALNDKPRNAWLDQRTAAAHAQVRAMFNDARARLLR